MGTFENMAARLLSETSKAEGSFATDNLRAVAAEMDNIIQTGIEYMPQRFFPTLAQGEDLTRAAQNFGVIRKAAVSASVVMSVSGVAGAMVYKGMQAAADGLLFTADADAMIPAGGTVDVKFVANESGAAGNVPMGVVNQFITTYPGLMSIKNTEAAFGGADAESDADLRLRVLARWGTPSTGGNAADYVRWALDVPGVARAKAVNPSAGNVFVYIVKEGNVAADTAIVAATQAAIDTKRPLGAKVMVKSGSGVVINIMARLVLSEGYALNTITQNIREILGKYIAELTFAAASVSYGKILNLMFVAGVVDVLDCKLNNAAQSITLAEAEFPMMGVTQFVT